MIFRIARFRPIPVAAVRRVRPVRKRADGPPRVSTFDVLLEAVGIRPRGTAAKKITAQQKARRVGIAATTSAAAAARGIGQVSDKMRAGVEAAPMLDYKLSATRSPAKKPGGAVATYRAELNAKRRQPGKGKGREGSAGAAQSAFTGAGGGMSRSVSSIATSTKHKLASAPRLDPYKPPLESG